MIGLFTRLRVHVEIVAQGCGCCNGCILVLVSQLRKAVVDLFIDDGMLFDPANFAFFGFHMQKAAAVLNDFKRLPVCDLYHDV